MRIKKIVEPQNECNFDQETIGWSQNKFRKCGCTGERIVKEREKNFVWYQLLCTILMFH